MNFIEVAGKIRTSEGFVDQSDERTFFLHHSKIVAYSKSGWFKEPKEITFENGETFVELRIISPLSPR